MGIFRFENKYAAPSREQRERYMRGEVEEHHFGPDDSVTLLLYEHAAYLKDDIDGVRILFTGDDDKRKAVEEAAGMVEYHQNKANARDSFRPGDTV
jgi:hypothetical protein